MQQRNYISPWWREDKPHTSLIPTVQFIQEHQDYQRSAYIHFLRLYSNRTVTTLTGSDFSSAVESGDRIRLNVVRSCIDTATAQIAAERARPMHTTKRGNIDLREKCRKIDQYILGQFHALRHYQKSLGIFRDAGIFGTGYEKFYNIGNKLFSERVPAPEIVTCDRDARYGDPRNLYHVKREVDREQLAEIYPEKAPEIMDAKILEHDMSDGHTHSDFQCTVVEAWRLPSLPGGTDGAHVIAVDTATLLAEAWSDPFPFATWSWADAPYGFLGMGLAEELAPIQLEINYIAQKIQRLMTLATTGVWVHKGSGVSTINNRDMAVREFTGQKPIFQTVSAVSAEYFHHLDRLYDRAFETSGISQMAAQSKKPAGLESGEALKTFYDIGLHRHRHRGQRWGDYHIQAGERILEASRRALMSEKENIKTLTVGDKTTDEISFSEINVTNDKYMVHQYPASLMPEEPAGKIDMLEKIANISPDLIPSLMGLMRNVPDVDLVVERMTAASDIAEQMVSNILNKGLTEIPDPYMNLALTRDIATKSLLRARFDSFPEERVEMLRIFINKIDALQAAAQPVMPESPQAISPTQPFGSR